MLVPHRARAPFVYLEYTSLKIENGMLKTEAEPIPMAGLSAIVLGPGTTVTHRAVVEASKSGTMILWVGEEGVFIYSAGKPLNEDPSRILEQVKAFNYRRDKIARAMFEHRFGKVGSSVTIEQLRGMEGARVKKIYADLAAKHNVVWTGRDSKARTGINAAISAANGHLYAAGTVAVITAGLSPSIGFIHSGFERAFVCDIVDLIKFEMSVPLAFKVWSEHQGGDLRKEVRHAMRDAMRKDATVSKMIDLSLDILGLGK